MKNDYSYQHHAFLQHRFYEHVTNIEVVPAYLSNPKRFVVRLCIIAFPDSSKEIITSNSLEPLLITHTLHPSQICTQRKF